MLSDLPIGEPVPYCKGSLGEGLDLHAALIPNPVCTFYMRVSGNGMRQHGIKDGDLMVIDRSVEPCDVDPRNWTSPYESFPTGQNWPGEAP